MLHLHIGFEGSWTNSFLDEDHNPRFTSGSGFGAGNRQLKAVVIPDPASPHSTRVDTVRAMNRANPGMTYQVPANYDNTVRGIVARLLGEVRRLNRLEPEHLVRRIADKMTYQLKLSSEHDEIVALATPPNEIQSGGAGLLPAGNPLYEKGELAKKVFGHLDHPFEALLSKGLGAEGAWAPYSPTDLVTRLAMRDDEQDLFFKALKSSSGEEAVKAVRKAFATGLADALKEAKLEVALSVDKPWSIAGALLAAKVHLLTAEEKTALIEVGALSRAGNLPGLAMSGGLGGLTIKDLYAGAGCKKAISSQMPYTTELWLYPGEEAQKADKKKPFSLGIIKKSGTLEIAIDIDEDQAREVTDHIEAASVGVFHFGKKGIAYVQRIYYQAA